MSLLSVAGVIAISLLVVGVLGALYQRSRGATLWVPRVLRLAALALTLGIAAVTIGWVWQDSGSFGLVLIGVPLLCCLVAVVSDATGFRTAMLTTVAAVGLLIWSLLTVVGLGLYFVGPAILLAAAAATTWQHDRRTHGETVSGSPAKSSA